jgi:regulatory protein
MSQNSDSQSKIQRAVLDMLSRRDYTRLEITQKLKSKGHSQDTTEPVITELVQAGMINERRLAESYIHSRRCKGYGPHRISSELKARGITAEMIAELLEITDNSWFAEAHKIWLKHFKGKMPCDFKNRVKQIRFLQYRGFTLEQIESVIPRDRS